MGLPTTLAILERLLRQRADAEVKNKRSSRISRIPLYSPFHSRHLLSPELKATKEVVERRGIFASTAFDEKKSTAKPATLLYSTVDGQQVSLDDGPLDALLDMVYLNPSRWDHVVASVVRDTKAFVKKNPGTPVEVLNVGPGGGLGQILAQRIEHATLVDLEEQVLVGAKRAAINPVPPPGAIAIVSTAVRAPGDVKSSNDLWEVHCEGVKPQKVSFIKSQITGVTEGTYRILFDRFLKTVSVWTTTSIRLAANPLRSFVRVLSTVITSRMSTNSMHGFLVLALARLNGLVSVLRQGLITDWLR